MLFADELILPMLRTRAPSCPVPESHIEEGSESLIHRNNVQFTSLQIEVYKFLKGILYDGTWVANTSHILKEFSSLAVPRYIKFKIAFSYVLLFYFNV
jgi:hypothetical protein